MVNKGKCVYTSEEALSWMVDVAGAIKYLHERREGKPVVIHR
jgi:serine/threonine protein kinase